MENNNSAIFKRLLALKKEGYTYLTSCKNDNYTDYDQAVQDCYEMDGNEPSYGDWVKESLQYYEINKYVTFHDGLLVIGESSTRYYDTESFDLDYENEQHPKYLEELLVGDTIWRNTAREAVVGGDARYIDLLAYAIWHLGFEEADQNINSIDEYKNADSDSEKIYISFRLDETEGAVKTVFVKDELWQNVEFLNEILKLNVPTAIVLSFIPESFKQNNDDFYKNLFMEDPSVFEFCSKKMRADKEVVMTAVSNDGWALKYASDDFKADKEVVLAAVTQRGDALEHASDALKADKEVVIAAVSQKGYALKYASEKLQNDPDIIALKDK